MLLWRAPLTHPTTLRWSTSLRLRRKEVKNKSKYLLFRLHVRDSNLKIRLIKKAPLHIAKGLF
jgi:hypothetical protein